MTWLAIILAVYGSIYFFIIRKFQKEAGDLEVDKRIKQAHLAQLKKEQEELWEKAETLKTATEEEKQKFWSDYLKDSK